LLIDQPPKIKRLKENNVRQGFVEREVYSAMLRCLPRHQQMLFCFGYYLGIRKGEAHLPRHAPHGNPAHGKGGIPRAEAMQITGHKTEAVYKRYDIASERGAIESGRRVREHLLQQAMREEKLGDRLRDAPESQPPSKTN
jgi:hypothetical protein